MKNLTIIAAIGKNHELGKNNDLIWKLPNDLEFFKEKTTGKTIVMGSKTFASLGRLLPNRRHIVLTLGNEKYPEEVIVYHSVEELLKNISDEEIFIIGGASIYKAFINIANKMYLTEINEEADADVYFPEFIKEQWNREVVGYNEDNGIKYEHVLYVKK